MRILLATDGSTQSSAMIKEFAGRHFEPDTTVRIISAYEKSSFMQNNATMGTLTDYYAEKDLCLLKFAERATQNATITLHDINPDLNISTAVVLGCAKQAILAEAEKFNADLIVVGSHKHEIFERLILGSVSESVAHHAKCSVEIIRTKPD